MMCVITYSDNIKTDMYLEWTINLIDDPEKSLQLQNILNKISIAIVN